MYDVRSTMYDVQCTMYNVVSAVEPHQSGERSQAAEPKGSLQPTFL